MPTSEPPTREQALVRAQQPPRPLSAAGDVLRGGAMGVAEVIPGVSGGTVALVLGIYATLIRSAGHVVRAVKDLVVGGPDGRGLRPALEELRQVGWSVVLPVAAGMVVALLVAARVLEPVLEEHPVGSRAVFAGMIVASISVPAAMVGGRWTRRELLVAAVAAAAAFALTGLPPASGSEAPPLVLVSVAAAFAVCALVLPGVSGSFLLLTVGLYEPTLEAVNDRDLPYVGAFLVGAVLGLSVFVVLLQWLLDHHHRVTLVVMTGLLAGSLRALWPWQTEDRGVLAPQGDVLAVVALFLAGAAVVGALAWVQAGVARREARDLR